MRECTLVTTLLCFLIIILLIAAVGSRSIRMSLKLLTKTTTAHKQVHNRSIVIYKSLHYHMINN